MSYLRELLSGEEKRNRVWIPVIEFTTILKTMKGINVIEHEVQRALLVFDLQGEQVSFIERFDWYETLAHEIDILDNRVFYHAVKLIKQVSDNQTFPDRRINYFIYDVLLWTQMQQIVGQAGLPEFQAELTQPAGERANLSAPSVH
jgi:hypothetical protein